MVDPGGFFALGFAKQQEAARSLAIQEGQLAIQNRQLEIKEAEQQQKKVAALRKRAEEDADKIVQAGLKMAGLGLLTPDITANLKSSLQSIDDALIQSGQRPIGLASRFDQLAQLTPTASQVAGIETDAEIANKRALIDAGVEAPVDTRTPEQKDAAAVARAGRVAEVEARARAKFREPKSPSLRQALDTQTNQPVFATDEQILSDPARFTPIPSGLSLEVGDDGSVRFRSGALGDKELKPPSGYRFKTAAEGGGSPADLEPIPGGPADKPKFTASQAQTAGFAQTMMAASLDLQAAIDSGFDPVGGRVAASNITGLAGDAVRNLTLGELGQQYEQAKRFWIRGQLRKDTGATINDQEFSEANKTFFPQVGDSPEVIEQKRLARQQVEDSFIAESQGAFESMLPDDLIARALGLEDDTSSLAQNIDFTAKDSGLSVDEVIERLAEQSRVPAERLKRLYEESKGAE